MRLLFIIAAIMMANPLFAESRKASVCYFSLNNGKEFTEAKKFAEKINRQTSYEITVREYLNQNENPEAAFERMVKSGAECDGLVISGHHYGAWTGNRAQAGSSLKLDFIEKLSCDPKYKKWFENINSLHLQGCRTLGVGTIAPDDVNSEQFSANAQTERLQGVATEDNINGGFAHVNNEFANTLDQDNVLSSRYLRMFPHATTFGWTKTAPGENSHSEYSLLYHIAHMAKINNIHQRGVFINPLNRFSDTSAVELATAVMDLLQKPADKPGCVNASIQAWRDQGLFKFNNKDLNGLPSYADTNNEVMVQAGQFGCDLKNATNQSDRVAALNRILSNPTYIAANFNAVVALVNEKISESDREELFSMIRDSSLFKSFIGTKFNTPQVGIFAKIDYYTFFKKVYRERSPDAERIIGSESRKILLQPMTGAPTSEEYLDLMNYKATLTDSLADNNFIDSNYMMELRRNNTPVSNLMYQTLYYKSENSALRNSIPVPSN